MDIGVIAEFVTSVGFPIACCIYLIRHNEKEDDKNREERRELSNVVSNNTIAITHLLDKLKDGKEEI